ncbi:MAG: thermonuclease family protein [Planctomycetota bacterium]
MRILLGVLLAAVAAAAAEPDELLKSATQGSVRLEAGGKTVAAGAIVQIGRGLILIASDALGGNKSVELRLPSGEAIGFQTIDLDKGIGLMLLKTDEELYLAGAGVLKLAPAMMQGGDAPADVYTLVFPAGGGDKLLAARLVRGRPVAFRQDPNPKLADRIVIEYPDDAPEGAAGGLLLDSQGRLLGLHTPGASKPDRAFAVPINAVIEFMRRTKQAGFGALPMGALPLRRGAETDEPDETDESNGQDGPGPTDEEPVVKELPPAAPSPTGIDYGPYRHYFASRAMAELKARCAGMMRRLNGLNYKDPTCGARGVIEVMTRRGYYIGDAWVPPVFEARECPSCKGRRFLFNERVAKRFVRAGLDPKSGRDRQDRLARGMSGSLRTYGRGPKLRYRVRGRYARVEGNDTFFPLDFVLVPDGRKHKWYLHDPEVHGPFDMEREFKPLPGRAQITEVFAGDVVELDGKRLARICGVTIPAPDGKLLKPQTPSPDEETRSIVRSELYGKQVTLKTDKYAQFDYDGLPLAFIELDGKDYGEGLVRRGLARRHPKHQHVRAGAYKRAEKAARAAKAGVWAELLPK